ncbi:adhesin [Bacillus tianshenii]|nr:adhesin [Bacillus tianshenii]
MNITNAAKELLIEAMEQNEASNIRFYHTGTACCGPQVGLSLDEAEDNDQLQEVNGITVAIEDGVEEMITNATLDRQGESLTITGLPETDCC